MSREKRHNSRVIVLEKLFETQYAQDNPQKVEDVVSFTDSELKEISEISAVDADFAAELYDETITHTPEIDELIKKYATEWPIENIPRTDLMILRMAILEAFILKLTEPKIVIDESIELAKEFCNDQSRKFISGVLGSIYESFEKEKK